MASTTTKKETASERAKRLNAGGGKATSGKAATGAKTQSKAKAAGTRQIDVVAKVITDLGGKAKLADVAKVVEDKKLIPNLGDYTYRKLYGIILRDKGKTVVKAGKGEFKVAAKKS